MGIKITLKNHENIGITLKKFRKLCEKEGLMRDIRRQEAYEKPSEKKRRKYHKAQLKIRQAVRENQRLYGS